MVEGLLYEDQRKEVRRDPETLEKAWEDITPGFNANPETPSGEYADALALLYDFELITIIEELLEENRPKRG